MNKRVNPGPRGQGAGLLCKAQVHFPDASGALSAQAPPISWLATQSYETVTENSRWSWRILIRLIIPTLLGSGVLQVQRRDDKSKDKGDQKILHLSLWGTLNFIVTQSIAPLGIFFSEDNSSRQSALYLTKAPWRTNHLPVACMIPC